MSTDIHRIAELAKEDPKRQFSSIAHRITVAKLYGIPGSSKGRQFLVDLNG
jgi:hypothetical protein